MNPFLKPPRSKFLSRVLGPAAVVFWVGFLIMGAIANSGPFKTGVRNLSSISEPASSVRANAPVLDAGEFLWDQVLSTWGGIPEVCWGNAVNDFQRQQCGEFWTQLSLNTFLAALPFVGVLAFLVLSFDLLGIYYRRFYRKVKTGQAVSVAQVTKPAKASGDLFSWLLCLRAVSVQLSNQKQIRVYIPHHLPLPQPGQSLALFDAGTIFGSKRYVAILYAPHLAIVAGTR